jgi:hypothetical protein
MGRLSHGAGLAEQNIKEMDITKKTGKTEKKRPNMKQTRKEEEETTCSLSK